MELLSLAISLMLPLQGGHLTGEFSLEVHPVIAVEVASLPFGAAQAYHSLVLLDRADLAIWAEDGLGRDEVLRHELLHARQQGELGLGYWVAYAVTLGRPFEPTVARELAHFDGDGVAVYRVDTDYSTMWLPPPAKPARYPTFRLAGDSSGLRLELFPINPPPWEPVAR